MKRNLLIYHPKIDLRKARTALAYLAMALLLSSCHEVTVQVVGIPGNTPSNEPIYITGNFNNWDPGDDRYLMQQVDDSVFQVRLPRGIGSLEYKFTRGDWTTVEKDLCGFETENRVLVYGQQEVVTNDIESWNDLSPVDCPRMMIVLDSLPVNTPRESYLSVAGTFNGWNPAEGRWQFHFDSALGKQVLRLPRVGDDRTIRLVVTRGSLERIESDAMGNEIEARQITFGEQDTVFLTVEGWADLERQKGNLLTVIVRSVPANTPSGDPIYITGSFNGWYPRQGDYRMEKDRQGQYFIHMPKRGKGFECKFTRGEWSTEEVDRWGYRINNRVIGYQQDTVYLTIDNWRDLTRPGGPPVRVIVESVPHSTPEDAELFIAGNFNNWNPGDRSYKLTATADGTYFVDVPRSEHALEFKITRGNWGSVECRTGGEDIGNRSYEFRDITEVRISVEAWKDR